MAYLKVTVDDGDAERVGRRFSNAVVELALASVPGFTVTTPPGRETPLVRYWPAVVAQVDTIVNVDGERRIVRADGPFDSKAAPPVDAAAECVPVPSVGSTVRAPIGRLVGARSGDKGGHANLGVWARTPDAYAWLESFLTIEQLEQLLPDTAGCTIDRVALPNLSAVNFVIRGYLGEGVASSTRWDPQAKTLGEYFRSRVVAIPEALLAV